MRSGERRIELRRCVLVVAVIDRWPDDEEAKVIIFRVERTTASGPSSFLTFNKASWVLAAS
jgi:hypothetical protein